MRENYNKQLVSFTKQYRYYVNDIQKRLRKSMKRLKEIENDGNEEEIQELKNTITADQDSLSNMLKVLNSIRNPFLKDINERENMDNFVEEIKKVIPNGVSLAFHGNGRIESVEDIIRSGGIYTQKDRGFVISFSSPFICVCTKNDIKIASDTANMNGNYCVPYGALFVLAPKDELEKKRFLSVDDFIAKGKSSSFSTTTSLNFHDEPDRLVAIITTNENLYRLKEVARENGLNDDLIVTHNDFIQRCKQEYENNKHVSL